MKNFVLFLLVFASVNAFAESRQFACYDRASDDVFLADTEGSLTMVSPETAEESRLDDLNVHFMQIEDTDPQTQIFKFVDEDDEMIFELVAQGETISGLYLHETPFDCTEIPSVDVH